MNAIDRIEAADVEALPLLNEADTFQCEEYQYDYDRVRNHLFAALDAFEKRQERNPMPSKIEYDERDKEYIVKAHQDRKDFYNFCYDPAEDIAKARNKILALNQYFIKQVEKYFNAKYNLTVSFDKEVKDDKLSYKSFVEQVFAQCDGFSLEERGIANLKEEFRNHSPREINLKNDKVQFNSFVNYDSWSENSIDYRCRDKMLSLASAFTYFETGVYDKPANMFANNIPGADYKSDKIEIGTDYEFPLQDKVVSIRFFKNRRLDIKFIDRDTAREFCECFNLQIS
jgi:hypothetical protein